MGEVIGRIVKEHISQAATEDDPENQSQIKIVDMVEHSIPAKFSCLIDDQQVGGGKADDVHEAIPADLQRAEGEEDRIDRRIFKHKEPGG